MTTAITYGYVEGDYVLPGYVVEFENISIEFRHSTAGTISFEHGFRYPSYTLNIVQPVERTICNVPIYFSKVFANMPFDVIFPWMTDAELENLRGFMFDDLPYFGQFTLALVGQDMSFPARFGARRVQVQHVIPGINEVSISMIRV